MAATLALAAHTANASTLITFDELTATANAPGSNVPLASQLSTGYLASLGVSFSSGGGFAAVVNHVPGCTFCTPTPFNIIGGTNSAGQLSYSTPIEASFFSTANTSIKATTNFVKVLGDWVPQNMGRVFLEAYDVNGVLLGSSSAPDIGAAGQGVTLSLSLNGIHPVRFYSNNATVGFDNFEFGALNSAIPEPASWATMLIGFGLVGSIMRRRQRPLAV